MINPMVKLGITRRPLILSQVAGGGPGSTCVWSRVPKTMTTLARATYHYVICVECEMRVERRHSRRGCTIDKRHFPPDHCSMEHPPGYSSSGSPHNEKIIAEGITFDDVLLIPEFSTVTPNLADTRTRLTRGIQDSHQ